MPQIPPSPPKWPSLKEGYCVDCFKLFGPTTVGEEEGIIYVNERKPVCTPCYYKNRVKQNQGGAAVFWIDPPNRVPWTLKDETLMWTKQPPQVFEEGEDLLLEEC